MDFVTRFAPALTVISRSLGISVLLTGCTISGAEPRAPSPFKPVATLQEIMTAIIDPNIDAIWNSVSSVSTAKGVEERHPQTDQDWLILKQHALSIAEAANLLLIENRPIAAANAITSSGGAELNPTDIKILISSRRHEYANRVHGLQETSQRLIAAIDAKNVEELEKVGGEVEQACEQCHSQFWYPGDKRPK